MLAAAGIEFKHEPVNTREEFLALVADSTLPFSQMPVLHIDGLLLTQSGAMVRYVAARGGLAGGTPQERYQVDAVVDAAYDLFRAVSSFPFLDAAAKEQLRAAVPGFLAKLGPGLDRVAALNAAGTSAFSEEARGKTTPATPAAPGSAHMVGSALTAADVCVAHACNMYELFLGRDTFRALLEPYPSLRAVLDTTLAHPGIKAYLESDLRYPAPDVAYAAHVDEVLGRK